MAIWQPFIMMIASGILLIFYAFYLSQIAIELDEKGISFYSWLRKPKQYLWSDIFEIKYQRILREKPYIYLIYLKKNRRIEYKIPSGVDSEIIRDIYIYKNISIPKPVERCLTKSLKKTATKQKRKWIINVLFALFHFCMGIGICVYYVYSIPYGPASRFLSNIILFWILGFIIYPIHIGRLIEFAPEKAWLGTLFGSGYILFFYAIGDYAFSCPETIILLITSWFIVGLFGLVTITLLETIIIKPRFLLIGAILVTLLVFIVPLLIIPKPEIRKLAMMPKITSIIDDLNFTPDGKKVVLAVNEKLNSQSLQSLYFISLATHKIERVTLPEGCSIFNLQWSPDNTKFIANGSYNNTTPHQSKIILGDLATMRIKALKHIAFDEGRDWYNNIGDHSWSPDGRLVLFWGTEYSSKTTRKPVTKLFCYSPAINTTKLVLQINDEVSQLFWMPDSSIRYFTHERIKKNMQEIEFKNYYTLWRIPAELANTVDRQNSIIEPEKVYESIDPWSTYAISPTGKYVIVFFDIETSVQKKYNILDTKTITYLQIPYLTSSTHSFYMAWHPKEDRVVYCLNYDYKSNLYEYDLAHRTVRRICSENGKVSYPKYSDTGNRISYYVGTKYQYPDALVSVRIDGNDWRRVYPASLGDWFWNSGIPYIWQPNEDTIVYLEKSRSYKETEKVKVFTASFN